ncbi:hypothetical protein C3941_09435 [Kaistia algarum]|uniref:hypothetical protein n=1 Tax=Kaistia algarum TaxID=2083279 RepID=UPI000CE8D424|nr:hypothetical protein [Kaistia algarum]MCX5512280.1 hypothetical protein [Kaistia algarum]PPE80371.1 hypothetical protein C3941_09435 [Kaistia algarum]
MTAAPKKWFTATRDAPVAGRWRKKGATFQLTEREASAERIWGVIEEVTSKRTRRRKARADD